MASQRQNKMGSKKMTGDMALATGAPAGPNPSPRPNPWSRNFASPPMNNSRPLPANGQPPPSAFPPLNTQSPKPTSNSPRPGPGSSDALIQTLTSLVDQQVMVFTHSGSRHQGTVVSTITEGDGQGVNLKDVKDILKPNAPPKSTVFIHTKDILGYNPVNDKPPVATNGSATGFRTDTDISNPNFSPTQSRPGGPAPRERLLEVWQPPIAAASPDGQSEGLHGDALTFGGDSSGMRWDQFEANKQMFGVETSFNEELYTTKLDRNRPDFKERERRAQIIADEILGGATSNPHLAEERGRVDDSGRDEEDKYGAVVRSPGAYVPPGARQAQAAAPPSSDAVAPAATVAPIVPVITKQDGPKVTIVTPEPSPLPVVVPTTTLPSPAPPAKGAEGLVNDFRSFVKNEKTRLAEKKQALAKNDMDKRKADLLKFSQSFKLNKPIPDDLVSILAKDEQKQKAIKEKSLEDAASTSARVIGPSITSAKKPTPAAAQASKPDAAKAASPTAAEGTTAGAKPPAAAAAAAPGAGASPAPAATAKPIVKVAPAKKLIPRMVLQPIPPFNPNKLRGGGATGTGAPTSPAAEGNAPSEASGASAPGTLTNSVSAPPGDAKDKEKEKEIGASASAAIRLNINAHSFKPTTVKPSPSQTSSSTSSQKASEAPSPPNNAFFGTRVLNKKPVHLKEEFSSFKHNPKAPDASSTSERWPYTGKRYMTQFGPLPGWNPHGSGPHLGAAGTAGANSATSAVAHMAAPMPGATGLPPPTAPMPTTAVPGAAAGQVAFEDDPTRATPVAAAGYMYYPYPYPSQMMPGVPPPPGYMHPQYVQTIPYPPNMGPPNGPPMYPPMPGMPPPHFMPPPGTYVQPPPPPNGTNGHGHGPRPSMPTPVPSHAHPYPYHHSPQLQHAVPYHPTMIMQGHHPGAGGPPPGGPPHMYEGPPTGAASVNAAGVPPTSTSGASGPVPVVATSASSQGGNGHHPQHQHHNSHHGAPGAGGPTGPGGPHSHHPGHHPHAPHHHQSPTTLGMMAGHS